MNKIPLDIYGVDKEVFKNADFKQAKKTISGKTYYLKQSNKTGQWFWINYDINKESGFTTTYNQNNKYV